MRTRTELALALLAGARRTFHASLRDLTLDEALSPAGGYRSVLGVLKHTAAWTDVYHSYAFDPQPHHWRDAPWPRGLRDTIDASDGYLREVIAWQEHGAGHWIASIAAAGDDALDQPHRCHWGATAPLFDIVVMVVDHWSYHGGEVNALLAIIRGHAWEYTEEVEENHISTAGHRLRPGWMNETQARAYEAYITARDAQLAAPHPKPGSADA